MKSLFRGRTLPAAALAAGTAAVLLLAGKTAPAGLPGPEELPGMGWEAAEAAVLGLPRQEILNAWGGAGRNPLRPLRRHLCPGGRRPGHRVL